MTRIIDLPDVPNLSTDQKLILAERFISVEAFLVYLSKQNVLRKEETQTLVEPIAALEQYICREASQALITGQALYDTIDLHVHVPPTGFHGFDDLLAGGIWEGHVTEFCGDTCAGKTQLCHLVAATTLARGERVVYVDTTNSFSARRLLELYRSRTTAAGGAVDDGQAPGPTAARPPRDEDARVLERVALARVHDVFELLTTLNQVAEELGEAAAAGYPEPAGGAVRQLDGGVTLTSTEVQVPRLFIIDSISAVLGSALGSVQHSQGTALSYAIGQTLRRIARQYHMAVLVTNHVTNVSSSLDPKNQFAGYKRPRLNTNSHNTYAGAGSGAPSPGSDGPSGRFKPALGEAWRCHVSARVMMAVDDETSDHVAELTSSAITVCGKKIRFRIHPSGFIYASGGPAQDEAP